MYYGLFFSFHQSFLVKLLALTSAVVLASPAASAQSVYEEFMNTLQKQNQRGCDTSYVGGYVSLYQSLTLLCNLRKDEAISETNFMRYSEDVIEVLGTKESSNIKAALMYARETCKTQGVELPMKL